MKRMNIHQAVQASYQTLARIINFVYNKIETWNVIRRSFKKDKQSHSSLHHDRVKFTPLKCRIGLHILYW